VLIHPEDASELRAARRRPGAGEAASRVAAPSPPSAGVPAGRRWLAIVRGDHRPIALAGLHAAIVAVALADNVAVDVVRAALDLELADAGGLAAWEAHLARPRPQLGRGLTAKPGDDRADVCRTMASPAARPVQLKLLRDGGAAAPVPRRAARGAP
jgi:hypothetical protein